MRKLPKVLSRSILPLALVAAGISPQNVFAQEKPLKEWTMIVFLNGNNNLDRYGAEDINEMETVGSTDQTNVVVQWASYSSGTTKRLLVKKDSNPNQVTSPVLEDLGRVDMGDWHNLVKFAKWAVEKYPAKHYMLDIWNHGGGWHRVGARAQSMGFTPSDISWDDNSGNFISTLQLGQAMGEIAQAMGHKVDLYGSDACLMAMAEVSSQLKSSVQYFAGSQETEPGDGWPYNDFLGRWAANPAASTAEVARMLTETYVKSYQGGSQGNSEVTFSSFNLDQQQALNEAIRDLGARLMTVSPADKVKVRNAIDQSQSYAYSDYADLVDFLDKLEAGRIQNVDSRTIQAVREAASKFVTSNMTSQGYAKSHGVSIWLPSSKWQISSYSDRYRALNFAAETSWIDALNYIVN